MRPRVSASSFPSPIAYPNTLRTDSSIIMKRDSGKFSCNLYTILFNLQRIIWQNFK